MFEGEGRFGVAADLGYGGELDGVLLTAPQIAVFGDGDRCAWRPTAPGTVPARQRQAAGGADRPLRPVRHEHAARSSSIALRDLQNDSFVWRDDPDWAMKRRTWSPDGWER